jgi:hypothetical protein
MKGMERLGWIELRMILNVHRGKTGRSCHNGSNIPRYLVFERPPYLITKPVLFVAANVCEMENVRVLLMQYHPIPHIYLQFF